MAELIARGGQVILISDSDVEMLSQFRWTLAKHSRGYQYPYTTMKVDGGKRAHVYMHRMIMQPPVDLVVDHINRNTLDNRRENLRICTYGENAQNKKRLNKTSKFIGVTVKQSGKINIAVARAGMHYHVPGFESEEVAARAYDALADLVWGEHASKNFPNEPMQYGLLPKIITGIMKVKHPVLLNVNGKQ